MIGLLAGWAWAQDPAVDGVPYVGLPLAEVTAAGFEPVLKRSSNDLWIALPEGGSARVLVSADVAAADVVFDGLARTSVTRWPPTAGDLPGQRAQGDGQAIVLVRDRNVVVWVRTPVSGDAAAVAGRLVQGLSTDPAACASAIRTDADGTWDTCGAFRGR